MELKNKENQVLILIAGSLRFIIKWIKSDMFTMTDSCFTAKPVIEKQLETLSQSSQKESVRFTTTSNQRTS